jgi:hypothetical protein
MTTDHQSLFHWKKAIGPVVGTIKVNSKACKKPFEMCTVVASKTFLALSLVLSSSFVG